MGVVGVYAVLDGLSPWTGGDPYGSTLIRWTGPALLALVILRLVRGERSPRPVERRFWRDITLALGVWCLAVTWKRLAVFVVSEPAVTYVLSDTLYIGYYVLLILAAERRPHREDPWRLWRLEHRLVGWTASLTVAALVGYFVLLPSLVGGHLVASGIPSYLLYTLLHLYVAGRFLFITRASTDARWRTLLGCLSIWQLTMVAAIVLEIAGLAFGAPLPIGLRWLTLLPFPAVMLVAVLRDQAFPADTRPLTAASPATVGLTPPVVTLLWALLFPSAHIIVYALGLVEPELRALRVDIVLVATSVLGVVAILQQRHLERRARQQEIKRRDVEAALRSSEDDLRLILERRRVDETVRGEREKFEQAFHLSPDGLAIGRAHGEVFDLNQSLAEIMARPRAELLAASIDELVGWLGLAPRVDDRAQIDVETRFVDASGRERTAVVALEPIEHRGRALVLIVVRGESSTVSFAHDRAAAAAFDDAELALVAVDADERIRVWNDAAERRFGHPADEMLHRTAADALGTGAAADDDSTMRWLPLLGDDAQDTAGRLLVAWPAPDRHDPGPTTAPATGTTHEPTHEARG